MWLKKSLEKVSEFRELAKAKQTIPLVTSFHEGLLPFIVAMIHSEKGKVKLLEFGGGIGFSYYQVMGGLPEHKEVEFHVVELDEVCQSGSDFFHGEPGIAFHNSLADCVTDYFDIVHVGSSLQYIEDWKGILKTLCCLQPDYLMLTNIPAGDIPTYATAQNYYDTTIASWFFNAQESIDSVIMYDFDLSFKSTYITKIMGVEQPYPQDNFPERYRVGYPCSMLFKRKR
jgi:putative methyltransferase (TIGR04325 family)